jgi:hypothetical protein
MEARNEVVCKRLQLKLSHQRERLRMEYNHRVQELELEGRQLVYDNQKEASCKVITHYENGKLVVGLIALPGVGKTGCALDVAYRMATHPDDEKIVEANNIHNHSGMNDLDWKRQYEHNMLPSLSENVAHRSTIKHYQTQLRDLEKGAIFTDEAHIASGKSMTQSRELKEAGLLNIETLSVKNNKLLYISATLEGVLEDINKWGDKAALVILEPSPMYKGFQTMLDEQRVRQAPELQNIEDVTNFLNMFERRYTGHSKRFFLMRGLNSDVIDCLRTVSASMGWEVRYHDSVDTISDVDKLMSNPPNKHTFILIKEFWRASKRVKRDYIGGTYEKPPKTRNTSATAQGLTARLCDNYNYEGEWLNPDLRPLHFCDLVAIEQYLDWYNNNCDYARSKYSSPNLKSNNGIVKARHSLMHPSNVDGLEEVEYESENTPTVDSYQMTELFPTNTSAREWGHNHINWEGEWNIRQQQNPINVNPCNPDGSPGTTHIRYRGNAHPIVTEADFRRQGDFGRFGAGVRCVPIKSGDNLSYTIVYKTSWLR